MAIREINLNSAGACAIGLPVSARLLVLMLITLVMLLPATTRADGLFDFQMKLAQKGNAEAEYKVGEMYETGFGVKKDMKEAMSWITKSASQGHETAGFKLLYWDMEKNGVTKANKEKVDVLKTKAKEGNPQAQYYVGKMHANGIGVKQNSDKAIEWLNKAALVGVLAAERELITVRESKQHQDLTRQKAKQRAELKARQEQAMKEKERQAHLKKQRKLQAKEKAQADKIAKQEKAAKAARLAAEKKAADEAAKQKKILAQKEAAAKQREAQKQALLKKRAVDEKKRKTQFESDPCSGKSARFLSTCR